MNVVQAGITVPVDLTTDLLTQNTDTYDEEDLYLLKILQEFEVSEVGEIVENFQDLTWNVSKSKKLVQSYSEITLSKRLKI